MFESSNLDIRSALSVCLATFLPVLAVTQPSLFKCSTQVHQNRVRIPPSLRAPTTEQNAAYWDNLFGKDLYRFSLVDHGFNCSVDTQVSFNLPKRNNFKRRKLGRQNQHILNDFYWTPEGTLKTTRNNVSEWNPPAQYCFSKITYDYIDVQVCLPMCAQGDVCLPKCCASSQVLSFNPNRSQPFSCTEVPVPEWQPEIYKSVPGSRSIFPKIQKQASIIFTHKKVPCRPFQVIASKSLNNMFKYDSGIIRILESGEVAIRKTSNHPWRKMQTDFCLDRVWAADDFPNFQTSDAVAVLYCEEIPSMNFIQSKIYLPVFIISSGFALLTVIVYGLLWDTQNVHGWTIAAFSLCMFFNLVTSAFAYGVGLFQYRDRIRPGSNTCVVIGILNHFFDVAMFSWLTVLCFDLWSTLSSLAPASARTKGYKRFLAYSSFGFGVPTVVVSVAIAIEVKYKNVEDTLVYKPLYGQAVCGVDKTSFICYTILVNMVLYVVNIIFAGLVLKTLREFRKGTKQATSSSSKKSTGRHILYLKLFVIMGITWVFEFIAWFAAGEDVKWYWSVFDVYNILQAVGIFWIFVCKAEIKEQLKEKYNSLRQSLGVGMRNGYRLHRKGSHASNRSDTKEEN